MKSSLFVLAAVAVIGTVGAMETVPHQYLPRFLLSQSEQAHFENLGWAKPMFDDVVNHQSTDPSMALRMVSTEIKSGTISYADLSVTKEQFDALVDQDAVGLSKTILQAAKAGTYNGTDFRLSAARSDLADFGYTLADVGLTEEEYGTLLKKYEAPYPTNSATLRAQMSTY